MAGWFDIASTDNNHRRPLKSAKGPAADIESRAGLGPVIRGFCMRLYSDLARRVRAASVVFAMLVAAAVAQSEDAPPRVIAGTNGEAEVIFNNNCVVYFDARGRETNHGSKCSAAARDRARVAIDAYRREQGLGGNHGGG
jgi:hypothetical protein